jgi:AcrR family transcriptional regulator
MPAATSETASVTSAKRVRRDPADAKELILGTAETIMRDEGYAAVTVRRVAKSAGLSSTLLHYYYPTADDLLVALYRRASGIDLTSLEAALAAQDPISALWAYQTDSNRTVLAAEFLALANHRKAIRNEIARFAEHARSLQARIIAELLTTVDEDTRICSPECLSMLLTSVSRNLIMEAAVGITSGHAEAKQFVANYLEKLRP